MDSGKARRRAAARHELRARRRQRGVRPVRALGARRAARHPPVEPAHHGRATIRRKLAIGRVLALQPSRLPPPVLGLARGRGDAEAVPRRLRRLRAGPPAGDALRRSAGSRARLRLRHVLRGLARVAAHEHLRARSVAAGARRAPRPPPGAAAHSRVGRSRGAAVLRRPPGVELSRAVRARGLLRVPAGLARPRPAPAGAGRGPAGARIRARNGGRGGHRRRGPPAVPGTGRGSTSARCSFTTIGAARPRARRSSRSW